MPAMIRKSFLALGTVNTITVFDQTDEQVLNKVAAHTLALDDKLSVFKEKSEIAQINTMAGKQSVPISADTLSLLQAAKRFSALTDGAFSVTSRPMTALWQIGTANKVPDAAQIKGAQELVNDQDLLLDEHGCRAFLRHPGQAIDLGAIAKGYAADEARRILTEHGITDALINFGGTVIAMGKPIMIGIQHPEKETGIPMGQLEITNKAVVTSGSYERFSQVEGRRYHHIFDPRTGAPAASGLCSVTLIGDSAMELDALSTALFVLGMEQGFRLAQQLGVEALFVTEQMDVLCSPALQGRFTLYPAYATVR